MNIVIHTPEPLVFRDGRPFGEVGSVYGGVLRWPTPTTIAGMARTRIGRNRDPLFFDGSDTHRLKQHIEEILKIKLSWTLPAWKTRHGREWELLFPRPADAVLVPPENDLTKLCIHRCAHAKSDGTWDHDLPWRNWRVQVSPVSGKPVTGPEFWKQSHFFSWLSGNVFTNPLTPEELGFSIPPVVERMHTAIDPATWTAKEGQLFASLGIVLETQDASGKVSGTLGIAAGISGTFDTDRITGVVFLGGERRTAFVDSLPTFFPDFPSWFKGKKQLRLILVTPGDFGGWAPSWLIPAENEKETSWRKVPGTEFRIRLISATIPPWQAVSGWDYKTKGPKAMRKLVPAGSVYLVELEQPEESEQVAKTFWGKSLSDGLEHPDGFGCVLVGNLDSI
jgi:CRISPR-associated protein Cmr3